MPLVVLDPLPVEIESLLERRRHLGLDRRDEMWDGVLHMNPSPHGRHHRIQHQLAVLLDRLRGRPVWWPRLGTSTSAMKTTIGCPMAVCTGPAPTSCSIRLSRLAVEIVSPGDETWKKLPFYAAHGVDEVLIVDPAERAVHWLGLRGGEYAADRAQRAYRLRSRGSWLDRTLGRRLRPRLVTRGRMVLVKLRAGRAAQRGGMRRAPSRRMTSPLSIRFSTMWQASWAYSAGAPKRCGKGTPAPSF